MHRCDFSSFNLPCVLVENPKFIVGEFVAPTIENLNCKVPGGR